jgi:uncharacterized membrane protein YfcA
MLDSLLAGFANISLAQLALVAIVALFAAVVGGMSGYGTGALMPLVLVPLVGAEPVVPIIAISALFTNTGRVTAFRESLDVKRALIVIAFGVWTCMLGAYGYTRLTGRGAAMVIGTMLIASVPLRRLLKRHDIQVGNKGLAAGAVGWGLIVGGTSGSGVILLSLLLAAGMHGTAVIATDAFISILMGAAKIAVFGVAGVITTQVVAIALMIGAITLPGAFVAKLLVQRMPAHLHVAMLDAVVILGGVVMWAGALRQAT